MSGSTNSDEVDDLQAEFNNLSNIPEVTSAELNENKEKEPIDVDKLISNNKSEIDNELQSSTPSTQIHNQDNVEDFHDEDSNNLNINGVDDNLTKLGSQISEINNKIPQVTMEINNLIKKYTELKNTYAIQTEELKKKNTEYDKIYKDLDQLTIDNKSNINSQNEMITNLKGELEIIKLKQLETESKRNKTIADMNTTTESIIENLKNISSSLVSDEQSGGKRQKRNKKVTKKAKVKNNSKKRNKKTRSKKNKRTRKHRN